MQRKLKKTCVYVKHYAIATQRAAGLACVLSKDSNQPGHTHSLIRVFAVRSVGS